MAKTKKTINSEEKKEKVITKKAAPKAINKAKQPSAKKEIVPNTVVEVSKIEGPTEVVEPKVKHYKTIAFETDCGFKTKLVEI